LVTRDRATAAAGSSTVLEFGMDEEKFKTRSRGAVYRDLVTLRSPGQTRGSGGGGGGGDGGEDSEEAHMCELRRVMAEKELEAGGSSFTMIAMRLRPEHEKRFKDTHFAVPVLARQLAHTYHYYLHPTPERASGPILAAFEYGASSSSSSGGGKKQAARVNIDLLSRGHTTVNLAFMMKISRISTSLFILSLPPLDP